MDITTDSTANLAADGANRLRAWVLASDDTRADAYSSVCHFLRGIRARAGSASFLVDEVAPRAVRTLAKGGHAGEAAMLLAFLSSFRPDRSSRALRVSHARQLAQLRQDLTTYTNS